MMSNNTYMNFKELDDITGIENQVYTLDQVWATSTRQITAKFKVHASITMIL